MSIHCCDKPPDTKTRHIPLAPSCFFPILIEATRIPHRPLRQPPIWSPCLHASLFPIQPATQQPKQGNSLCHLSPYRGLHDLSPGSSPSSSQKIQPLCPQLTQAPFCLPVQGAFPAPLRAGLISSSGFISKVNLQPGDSGSQFTLSPPSSFSLQLLPFK